MKKVNEVSEQGQTINVQEKLIGNPGDQTTCLQVGYGFCFGQGKFGRLFEQDEEGDEVLLDVLGFVIERRQENLGEAADEAAQEAVADEMHAKMQRFILAYAQQCQKEGRDISDLTVQLVEVAEKVMV